MMSKCYGGLASRKSRLEDNYLDMNNDQNEGVYDTGDIGTYVITKLNPPPGAYVSASCSFGVHT